MTRFARPFLGLVLIAGLAAPVRAAELDPLLPAETESVIFVNVRQILDSDLIKKYAKGQIEQALKTADAQKNLAALGLDPLKDIDRVTGGTWGTPEEMKGLFVVRGKFDPEKLFAAATAAAKKEEGKLEIVEEGSLKLIKIMNEKQKQPVFVTVADEKTIIGGTDKKMVAATVATAQKGVKPAVAVKKELAALLLGMDEKASLFVAGLADGKKVELPPNVNIPGVDGEKLGKQLQQLANVAMTINLTKDISFDISMGMKDADSAAEFGTTVDGLINTAKTFLPLLAGQQPQAKPLVDELTKTLASKVKDKNVTIVLKLTGDSIGKVAGGGGD